jgi:hypothetical protein
MEDARGNRGEERERMGDGSSVTARRVESILVPGRRPLRGKRAEMAREHHCAVLGFRTMHGMLS